VPLAGRGCDPSSREVFVRPERSASHSIRFLRDPNEKLYPCSMRIEEIGLMGNGSGPGAGPGETPTQQQPDEEEEEQEPEPLPTRAMYCANKECTTTSEVRTLRD
jgi:hypothetical protein